MKTPSKIIVAVALAGIAVAGGAAFTANAGLGNTGVTNQFIGGSAAQTITGAGLQLVEYGYDAQTAGGTVVNHVIVTLTAGSTDARGKDVAIAFSDGSSSTAFNCTAIPASGTMFSNCTGGSVTNPGNLKITVGSPTVTVTTPGS